MTQYMERDVQGDVKLTIIYLPSREWKPEEIKSLGDILRVGISSRVEHPHHIVLHGEHVKGKRIRQIFNVGSFVVTHVKGLDHPQLPFKLHE